jgi:hypothetical protein
MNKKTSSESPCLIARSRAFVGHGSPSQNLQDAQAKADIKPATIDTQTGADVGTRPTPMQAPS